MKRHNLEANTGLHPNVRIWRIPLRGSVTQLNNSAGPIFFAPNTNYEIEKMNMITRFLLALVLCLGTAGSSVGQSKDSWMETYNGLLGKYVTDAGVKYSEWKQNASDVQALQQVVDAIAKENASSLGKKEQLAFYINSYNAWILHEAVAKYPTKSVKDPLFTFFTSSRIKVAGEQMSFSHLEKDVIRSKFADPHVHFALNCASRSCPPLNREVFRADKLDAQLEMLAKAFVNSKKGVAYQTDNKTAALSAIFKWYKDDFKEGGPVPFINQRRSAPLPTDAKITFQTYDWSLNEAK